MDKEKLRSVLYNMLCEDCECLYEQDKKVIVDQALTSILELEGKGDYCGIDYKKCGRLKSLEAELETLKTI